jgi:hypothetical protein
MPLWMTRLLPYYQNLAVLRCPTDDPPAQTTNVLTGPMMALLGMSAADTAPRSYIVNGWNDWFEETLSAEDYRTFQQHAWPEGMRTTSIRQPSDTILFGEKSTGSGHVHMDFFQRAGNDLEELEHSRHSNGNRPGTGGSNFSLADGSSRFMKAGRCLSPRNLWGVTDRYRTNYATVFP